MGYSFMTIRNKFHDYGNLTRAYLHNYRIAEVPNANPGQKAENEELVKLVDKNGNPTNYVTAVKERLQELKYYETHNLRKNAVLAMDVLVSFPREDLDTVDLDTWKKENVRWLKETFNRNSEENGENVISVVYHGDENGSVHCHALVLPITEEGRFCASEFTGTRQNMRDLQNSYGKAMEGLGLKRGVKGSTAKHQDIKKFYAKLNSIQELPEAKKGETIDEYRERTKEEIQEWKSAEYRKILEKETRSRQKIDETRQKIIQSATREATEENAQLKKEVEKLKKEAEKAKTEADKARKEKEANFQIAKDVSSKIRTMDVGMEYIRKYQHLLDVTQYCKESMPEFVEKMEENFSIMEDAYAQREMDQDL